MSDWFGRPFSFALILFALAMTVFLSPVTTSIPREGQTCGVNGECLRICGFTLTQTFATTRPDESQTDRDSVADCVATARARVGYGLLFLLAAAPLTISGVMRTVRETAAEAPSRSVAPARMPSDT